MNSTNRDPRVGAILLAGIAIPLALITLLGLEPLPFMSASLKTIVTTFSQLLIQIVTVVGAIAVIIGVLNLLGVQVRKLRTFPRGLYSIVTLITFIAVIGIHLLERLSVLQPPIDATSGIYTLTLMDTLQVVIESALAGLLAFFLIYAAYRLMRRRVTLWSVIFIATVLIVLLGYVPFTGFGFLAGLRDWILRVPVAGGTRGLLIGVAIGTLTVGIRVLIGQDRTFRE